MARILTGIQSSGKPHLGNILGAIIPAIELSKKQENESLFFIANMHSLTSLRDAQALKENTYSIAAAWLAFGFDTDKNMFYRQSDIPLVTELAWYLNCVTPVPMLENAHSFKDKSAKFSKDKISAGLFTYPVLMAADILLYDAEIVPVGKDQRQHLEMTRDIAGSFNHMYGETFVLPEAQIKENVMTVPGLDGQKMSKSYNNFIDIFQEDKPLRKNIMKIVTDDAPLEAPKDPETNNVFKLYELLAEKDAVDEMRTNFTKGGYGYGHAKQALFELVAEKFKTEREAFDYYINNTELIEEKLQSGAEKATKIARGVLDRVREKVGV